MTTSAPIPILRFHPQANGLERWLGCLEAPIMAEIWVAHGPRTVKQVWHVLQRNHRSDIAYTTVMCTMRKLWVKGLLVRERVPHMTRTFRYRPSCSEAEFVELQARAIRASLEGA